ncbi:hypothetical protein CEXT_479711, partial [Caerostris extrusa]
NKRSTLAKTSGAAIIIGAVRRKDSGISTSREVRLAFMEMAPLETDDGASPFLGAPDPKQACAAIIIGAVRRKDKWYFYFQRSTTGLCGDGAPLETDDGASPFSGALPHQNRRVLQLSLGQCGGKDKWYFYYQRSTTGLYWRWAPLETDDGASPFLGALPDAVGPSQYSRKSGKWSRDFSGD